MFWKIGNPRHQLVPSMALAAQSMMLTPWLHRLKPCPYRISNRRSLAGPLRVRCVNWDPEGLLGGPRSGHIARRTIQKKLSADAEQQEALRKEVQQQIERRRAAREARVVPETDAGLIEFFLETEAQEMEFEIARCRLRLNETFFSHLNREIASLRFQINRTQEIEDKLIELETLEKVLKEASDAYDRLASDVVGAKERLAKIFASKDKKATLLEMVASNELDRSLLVLLDQNIATANAAGQKEAVQFMEKVRSAVIKYITL